MDLNYAKFALGGVLIPPYKGVTCSWNSPVTDTIILHVKLVFLSAGC